eukprot:7763120-Lingulodinium_polyedra.AAC.1
MTDSASLSGSRAYQSITHACTHSRARMYSLLGLDVLCLGPRAQVYISSQTLSYPRAGDP